MCPFFFVGKTQFFTYPLILGILFGFSYIYSKRLLNEKKIIFPYFNIFLIFCFLASWGGSKIFFLLSVNKDFATRAIVNQHFWLGGGFVFYGGLILGSIFTVIYAKMYNLSKTYFEFLVPVLLLCHSIGRIGCFLTGCCFGSETEVPWAIDNLHDGIHRHPVQIYEAIALSLAWPLFLKAYRENKKIIIPYIIFYACLRFFMEFFRGDTVRGIYALGISTSQIISLSFLIIIAVFTMVSRKKHMMML